MKNCENCGFGNADDMRFCLECGTLLPNAPLVVNIPDAQNQSGPSTNPYGRSMDTLPGAGYNQSPFSMVPPKRPRSSTKTFLVIGGILTLVLMLFIGVGAIVAYNLIIKSNQVTHSPTPVPATPSPAPTTPSPKNPTPKPTVAQKNTTAPSATFDRMSVDYNVRENGRLGMRIHVNFRVFNMKGVDSYLAVYFQKNDGTPLTTRNRQFSSTNGQVAVFYALKPGFDDTVYDDIKLFMPYDELNLAKGTYNLQMHVDVIYKNGDKLEHLNYYDFEYEKF